MVRQQVLDKFLAERAGTARDQNRFTFEHDYTAKKSYRPKQPGQAKAILQAFVLNGNAAQGC
jgi:hypothetical protein